MKKYISIFLVVIMIFSVFSISIYAEDEEKLISESVEYLDNGYYVVISLTENDTNTLTRGTSTKSGTKIYTLYNDDDVALVVHKLTATFSYTGSSSTCTSASVSNTIHNDQWKVPTATASKSGNVATGTFVAKHYVLFIVTQTINTTLKITCSKTGTLS